MIFWLLGASLLALSCQPQTGHQTGGTPPVTAASDPMRAAWEDRSVFRDGLVGSDQAILDRLEAATTYHIELSIQPDLLHLTGRQEVHYTNNEQEALGDIRFRLFPNLLGGDLRVTGLNVDGRPAQSSLSLRNSLLIVPLSAPLPPGGSVTLGMDFTVRVPDTVQLSYGVLASADGVLALAHAYPMIPVYDTKGWEAEIPPPTGDVTFTDMSFFLVRLTAPKNLVVAAVGRELSGSEAGDTQTITYAAGPVRDFYLAASPNYIVVSRQAGETAVNFYAPASAGSAARAGLDAAVRALEDFSQRYAPYPYTELDLVQTPTLALGVEYPGLTAIAGRIIEPGNPYLEATVAHEVAHQWFYNLVGSDQLNQPWLDESLAQFATLQYFTDEYGSQGASAFRNSLYARWDRVSRAPIPIGLPVRDYSNVSYGAIVYGRGGLFFEALRQKMGDTAYSDLLHDYTTTYAWGIATPEGLKALAEKHCACDLTAMFREWVYP
ncbi:MAG: M1 family metallopeptidase [Bacteroidota bacterium]